MSGAELIAAERQRQVEKEGWTPEHDDTHDHDELALAAAVYALPDRRRSYRRRCSSWPFPPDRGDTTWTEPAHWPWSGDDFKPTPDDRVRELVKAGALIAAEIDRLLRLQPEQPAREPRP